MKHKAVQYDFEFWPDVETAEEAIKMAETVHSFVLAGVAAGIMDDSHNN